MSTIPSNLPPTIGGHPDLTFKAALQKVSPQVQQKLKTTAQDFEAVFLGTMFNQMTEGLKGDGPFGSTVGTGAWRSMLTDEYAKSFAKAGGIGLSNEVYRTMIMQQAARSGQG
jgi:Rod binding domain-containing protein